MNIFLLEKRSFGFERQHDRDGNFIGWQAWIHGPLQYRVKSGFASSSEAYAWVRGIMIQ